MESTNMANTGGNQFDEERADSAVPRWFAVYTSARHEKTVARQLDQRCIEKFLPLYRSLRRKQGAQHIDVELLVEVFLGDRLDRREFIDARIIDQHVELAEMRDRCLDYCFGVRRLRYVALDRDSLAAGFGDRFDDLVGASLARRIVNHDCSALRR